MFQDYSKVPLEHFLTAVKSQFFLFLVLGLINKYFGMPLNMREREYGRARV
jgi:hypothetical protein